MRILDCLSDPAGWPALQEAAREIAIANFGHGVFLRGLIEISNYCRNDCRYCGIRRSNRCVERYRLNGETILACCETGYRIGLRTFVLQGGEDPTMTDEFLVPVITQIREKYPECAITLSLGERSEASYRALFEAGANRYLLRHETVNPVLYGDLHPEGMSLENRLNSLRTLKKIGFQTGTGFMVGVPGQTIEDIAEDLAFIRDLQPEMIGIGPFIPHSDTPLGHAPAGSVELTLASLSIARAICPTALIPSTTALASLSTDGRIRGILAGANVVMPNLSPVEERSKYSLYDGKAAFGAEAAEGIHMLERELNAVGYHISWDRGDYKH